MPDREKVIKGLECCFRGNDCRNCPYREVFNPERPSLDCINMTREDAIALLKEQEPVLLENQHKPYGISTNANSPWISRCPRCGKKVEGKQTRFCKYCGKAVKWE